MTLTGWEQNRFSDSIAWQEPGTEKTYQSLVSDIESLETSDSRIWIFEDQGPYHNALLYLKAWKQGKALCLLPKSWPETWKADIRSRILNFETEIPADTFYLLPTSGSSGRPKLVVVSRNNWTALMQSLTPLYAWSSGARVALAFDGVFDPFIAILFLALNQGATLVPLKDSDKFDPFTFLAKNLIQVWASVPSLISMNWSRKPDAIRSLPELRQTIFTGETLTPKLLSLWMQITNSKVDNLYGPVETTVWATRHACTSNDSTGASIPIGQPLPSVQASVQNEEFILSGPQVAVGYLTSEGLELFHGSYATGDRVTMTASEYVFEGRKDLQVKIRGQRIELEIIEALVLAEFNEASVCLTDLDQNLCLILPKEMDASNLFDRLKEKLPPSHLPRMFFLCLNWPKTSSGKLDRQALRKMLDEKALARIQLSKRGSV